MHRTFTAAITVLLVAAALAGCRQEEQGRLRLHDKGVYAGPADTALSKAQMERLTDRATLQADITAGGPAAGPATADTPTRAAPGPAQESSSPALDKALSERMRLQGN